MLRHQVCHLNGPKVTVRVGKYRESPSAPEHTCHLPCSLRRSRIVVERERTQDDAEGLIRKGQPGPPRRPRTRDWLALEIGSALARSLRARCPLRPRGKQSPACAASLPYHNQDRAGDRQESTQADRWPGREAATVVDTDPQSRRRQLRDRNAERAAWAWASALSSSFRVLLIAR